MGGCRRYVLLFPTSVGTPHQFLTQGGEIGGVLALYCFYAVWGLLKGDGGALAAFLAPAVKGDKEVMAATLNAESNHRLVGKDYRTHAQAVGRYGCEGKDVGAGDNDGTAYRK